MLTIATLTWWHGDRTGLLGRALDGALKELGGSMKDKGPSTWTWGTVHTMTFAHPMGRIGPLAPIFNRGPFPMGGDWNTVGSGAYSPKNPYTMSLGPALRIISDLANWDNSRAVAPTANRGAR